MCGSERSDAMMQRDLYSAWLQVNARKIYDEPSVLEGIFTNKLFLSILAAEAALQVSFPTSDSDAMIDLSV